MNNNSQIFTRPKYQKSKTISQNNLRFINQQVQSSNFLNNNNQINFNDDVDRRYSYTKQNNTYSQEYNHMQYSALFNKGKTDQNNNKFYRNRQQNKPQLFNNQNSQSFTTNSHIFYKSTNYFQDSNIATNSNFKSNINYRENKYSNNNNKFDYKSKNTFDFLNNIRNIQPNDNDNKIQQKKFDLSQNFKNKLNLTSFKNQKYQKNKTQIKKIEENTFQRFLQLAKKQKQRDIYIPPTYIVQNIFSNNSFQNSNFNNSSSNNNNVNKTGKNNSFSSSSLSNAFSSPKNKTSNNMSLLKKSSNSNFKKNNFIIQELRQTQDTVFDLETGTKQNLKDKTKIKQSDFLRIKQLGKGKNGQVYLVAHKVTGFLCAMKIIKKKDINRQCSNLKQKQMIYNQLLRQIKIQLFMSDPNIIQLYGVFDDNQNIYLLQQLGLNGQLYQFMKRKKKFTQETTALISRQVLKGLNALHSKNIIHRDIKPQNIVLVFGVAKICDFGWSVHCPTQLRKTLCGTPLYLSPQILIGDQYNEKIDIWAFGTLVYELFTGQNPFKIKTKNDLKRIVTDQLQFPESFPRRLKGFLQFILKKNLHQRPTPKQIEKHQFLKKYIQLQTCQQICEL